MFLRVKRRPGGSIHEGLIQFGGKAHYCSLGRTGIQAQKREGDGATPSGMFRLLFGFYRHDRIGIVNSTLPLLRINKESGWCDSPEDPAYNQPVSLPYKASHEELMREDRLYDVCIVLDYNISPRARERGSAIFFHQTRPDKGPTEGCVAIDPELMRKLLPRLSEKSLMSIEVS